MPFMSEADRNAYLKRYLRRSKARKAAEEAAAKAAEASQCGKAKESAEEPMFLSTVFPNPIEDEDHYEPKIVLDMDSEEVKRGYEAMFELIGRIRFGDSKD